MNVYKKYLEEQAKHPNSIILFRLGDFYEVLGLGANIVANRMDFTLMGRDCGIEERVLMVGFPFCMKDEVVKKLEDDYYQVYIVEQGEIVYE